MNKRHVTLPAVWLSLAAVSLPLLLAHPAFAARSDSAPESMRGFQAPMGQFDRGNGQPNTSDQGATGAQPGQLMRASSGSERTTAGTGDQPRALGMREGGVKQGEQSAKKLMGMTAADKASPEAKRGGQMAARCAEAESKLGEQKKRFDGMKTQQDQRFTAFLDRLDLVINKLQAGGLAATTLQADRAKLATMITELKGLIDQYKIKLQKAQALAPNCDAAGSGASTGDFKAALKDSRAQLQLVQIQAKAIRVFIEGTIRTDLSAARTQLMAQGKAQPTASPSPVATTSTNVTQ